MSATVWALLALSECPLLSHPLPPTSPFASPQINSNAAQLSNLTIYFHRIPQLPPGNDSLLIRVDIHCVIISAFFGLGPLDFDLDIDVDLLAFRVPPRDDGPGLAFQLMLKGFSLGLDTQGDALLKAIDSLSQHVDRHVPGRGSNCQFQGGLALRFLLVDLPL